MALTVTIDEYNGASETKADDITAIVFGSRDASDFVPIEYPIRPGSASFEKYIKVDIAEMVAEGVAAVSDMRIWKSAGLLKTGEALRLVGLGPLAYAQPLEATNSDAAIPSADPGSQNVALGGADDGTLVADGSSDYIRLQRAITGSTPIGALASLILTVSYDAT